MDGWPPGSRHNPSTFTVALVRQLAAVREDLALKENWWPWTVMGQGSGHLEYQDRHNEKWRHHLKLQTYILRIHYFQKCATKYLKGCSISILMDLLSFLYCLKYDNCTNKNFQRRQIIYIVIHSTYSILIFKTALNLFIWHFYLIHFIELTVFQRTQATTVAE